MVTIRGVYDGKTFRALPTETLPVVHEEVPVAIIFLEERASDRLSGTSAERLRTARSAASFLSAKLSPVPLQAAAQEMDALRKSIGPISTSVYELIEEGR